VLRPVTYQRKLAAGKSAAGAGLQVALERERWLLVCELHDDIDLPRPPVRRVEAAASMVRLEPGAAITGDAGVVALGAGATPENIDATLRDAPGDPSVHDRFRMNCLRFGYSA
jgi:hypothetical protein